MKVTREEFADRVEAAFGEVYRAQENLLIAEQELADARSRMRQHASRFLAGVYVSDGEVSVNGKKVKIPKSNSDLVEFYSRSLNPKVYEEYDAALFGQIVAAGRLDMAKSTVSQLRLISYVLFGFGASLD